MIEKPKVKSQKPKFWKEASFFILLVFLIGLAPSNSSDLASKQDFLILKINDSEALSSLSNLGNLEHIVGRFYRIQTDSIEEISKISGVEIHEDKRVGASLLPSDPLFVTQETDLSKQWYLHKVQVPKAWDQISGGSVTVAVVDTGIDGKHEDLNDGRIGKGFASYCNLRDLAGDCLLRTTGELLASTNSDDNGHGTIVAGVIGAVPNNNKGIAGINWNLRLMPIKALDAGGEGFASDVALGIKWAADSGARIINLSIGGSGLSGIEVLKEAVKYAWEKGALVISAAGNDSAEAGVNLNILPALPVCADGPENMVLGVAAVDAADKKAKFSNYGSNCVDISAPGTGIFVNAENKQGMISTYFDPTSPTEHNLYVYAIGTSMAAPIVSGIAALTASQFPYLDVKSLRDRLLESVDSIDEPNRDGCGAGSCIGQLGAGRINALKAVTIDTTIASGSLVRDGSGQVYLIEKGSRRPISEFVLGQRFSGSVIKTVSAAELSRFPAGTAVPPVDTTLIKDQDIPTVYLVEEGKLQALSYLAFISRNLRFSDVVTLPRTEITSYPLDADAPILNGVLIKSATHPAVYIVNNGIRQLLSYFVFLQRFLNTQVAQMSQEEVDRFPPASTNFLYPPNDGTLIKADAATVYLIMAGKRHALNLNAFLNRGFNFSMIQFLPQSEIEGYESGADIIE